MTTTTRRNPFKRIGTNLEGVTTTAQALKVSGLNWNVDARPLFHSTQEGVKEITTHRAFVRNDSEATLAVLGKAFTPLQNDKLLAVFDSFLDSGQASLEAAGSLKGGRVVYALAKLNKAPIVVQGDDVVQKYLMLSNSHDGTMSARIQFLPFRPVCTNILAKVWKGKFGQMIRIFHSKDVEENLTLVAKTIQAADAVFQATAEQYQELSRHGVYERDIKKYVELVFRPTGEDEERRLLALENLNQTIVRLFETGAGMDLPGAKGTWWGLYNAVSEYLTHEQGRADDSRLHSSCFGNNAAINARALQEAMVMVG